jgi:tetratricopeptide (TPR) repeat protein
MLDYSDIATLTANKTLTPEFQIKMQAINAELAHNPNNIELLLYKAFLFFDDKMDGTAIRVLLQILEIDPSCLDAYMWLGELLLFHWADSETAQPLLKKALTIDTRRAEIYYLLSCAATKNSNNAEALSYLKQAIELEPYWLTPRLCLIDILIEEKQYMQAQLEIQTLETHLPKNIICPTNEMEKYYEQFITGRLREPAELENRILEFKNRLANAQSSKKNNHRKKHGQK